MDTSSEHDNQLCAVVFIGGSQIFSERMGEAGKVLYMSNMEAEHLYIY